MLLLRRLSKNVDLILKCDIIRSILLHFLGIAYVLRCFVRLYLRGVCLILSYLEYIRRICDEHSLIIDWFSNYAIKTYQALKCAIMSNKPFQPPKERTMCNRHICTEWLRTQDSFIFNNRKTKQEVYKWPRSTNKHWKHTKKPLYKDIMQRYG